MKSTLLLLVLSTLHSALAFPAMPGTDTASTHPRCECTTDCYDPPTISDDDICDDQCATCYGAACEFLPGTGTPRCATCPAGMFLSIYGMVPYECIADCEAAGWYEKTSTDCGSCSDFDGSSACNAQSGCMWASRTFSSQGAGCTSSSLGSSGSASRVYRPRWAAAALAALTMAAAGALC